MEETVQVLLDEGALVRNGVMKLTKPIRDLKIPPTVQAILAARIDTAAAGHQRPAANPGRHRPGVLAVPDSRSRSETR
jgi:hypothetical protein